MVLQNRFLNIFSLKYNKKRGRGEFDFRRRLWEGQEIDMRSKIDYSLPFLQIWFKIFFLLLKLLCVDWPRARWIILCLSVNQSRDTFKSIFWSQTAIVTNLKIIKYLVSYVPHLEGLDSRIPKIYISLKSNNSIGSYHIFPFRVVKWPISTPDIRN